MTKTRTPRKGDQIRKDGIPYLVLATSKRNGTMLVAEVEESHDWVDCPSIDIWELKEWEIEGRSPEDARIAKQNAEW